MPLLSALLCTLTVARAGPAGLAGDAGTSQLVVVIDDRRGRKIQAPRAMIQLASGRQVQITLTDDGGDAEDLYADDYLFVGRVILDETGDARVWVTEGDPAKPEQVLRRADVKLAAGETTRVRVKGTPTASRNAERYSIAGKVDSEPAEVAPDIPIAEEPIEAAVQVNPAPWPIVAWLFTLFTLGLAWFAQSRFRRAVVGLRGDLDRMSGIVEGLARRPATEPVPSRGHRGTS